MILTHLPNAMGYSHWPATFSTNELRDAKALSLPLGISNPHLQGDIFQALSLQEATRHMSQCSHTCLLHMCTPIGQSPFWSNSIAVHHMRVCVCVCACVYMCVLKGIRILFSLLMCVCSPKRARRTNGTMLHHLPQMIKPCYWSRRKEVQSSSSC